MRKPFISLLLSMAVAAVAAQPAGTDQALQMVRTLQLGSNLPSMTYKMALLTQTRAAMLAAVGPDKTDDLLRAEIAAVTPKYQEEWDRKLADAWSPLMSAEEFHSVSELKQASPYAKKFVSLQGQAGAAMRTSSEPLLAKVLGEVMNGAFEKAMRQK